MDIALMCDLRILSRSASLAESYINMGVIAGNGGTYYLPRIVGNARALELFWTGRVISADEAERLGLATEVVADEQLLTRTYELARAIAAQPQAAVCAYKRAVYQGANMPLATHLDMISSHMSVLRDTDEHRSKVAAFLERTRKPKDRG
jgi:enoyl-CoA hydratase/carnithine racemase